MTTPITPTAARPSPPWRRRDFRIAWSAAFVNDAGDWVLTVALPVFVFVETRSGSATALLFVCQLLPAVVLGPFGGSIVDRVDLRRCLVLTNVAQAVTLLPLLAVTADRVWPAYVVIAVQAALTQVNNPANVSLLTRVVHDDELTTANATMSAASSLARFVGSPLGGVLVAWRGLTPVVAVDLASFLVVAASLSLLRADTSPVPDPAPTSDRRRDVRDGIAAVRANPPLGALLALQGFVQLAQGAFVVLFVAFVVEKLGDDGSGLGVIRGTMAVGALVGSAVIARLGGRLRSTTIYAAGTAGMGAVALVFWNAPIVTTSIWVYVLLFSLSGLPGAALAVGLFTTIQQRSPRHALGRVTGLLGTSEAAGTALGAIVVGVLIDHVPLGVLLDTQAAVYLTGGAIAAILVREHDSPAPASSRS